MIQHLTSLVEMLLTAVVAIVVAVMVAVVVPAMVVGDLAAIAIPVALKEALAIMMRLHPACSSVSRPGPVSIVPPIAMA